jgi:hypothetical protein
VKRSGRVAPRDVNTAPFTLLMRDTAYARARGNCIPLMSDGMDTVERKYPFVKAILPSISLPRDPHGASQGRASARERTNH